MDYVQITRPATEEGQPEIKYGFKFNQEFLELYLKETLSFDDKEITVSHVKYSMVFAALTANQRAKKDARKWTWEEACDFSETLTQEESESLFEAMNESTQYKKLLGNVKVREDAATADPEKKNTQEPILTDISSESTNSSVEN